MSESKFTAGPWVSSKFGYQVLTGDSWNTICELRGPAEWEDKRGSYEQEFEWQIQQANARLIAAAPDLLEALKDLSAEVASTGIFADWPDLRAQVEAAIAKAEGHQ